MIDLEGCITFSASNTFKVLEYLVMNKMITTKGRLKMEGKLVDPEDIYPQFHFPSKTLCIPGNMYPNELYDFIKDKIKTGWLVANMLDTEITYIHIDNRTFAIPTRNIKKIIKETGEHVILWPEYDDRTTAKSIGKLLFSKANELSTDENKQRSYRNIWSVVKRFAVQ